MIKTKNQAGPGELMGTKSFPRFRKHAEAYCFNCEGDLTGDYYAESGYAHGRGAYLQSCEKCQLSTWYDLYPEAN